MSTGERHSKKKLAFAKEGQTYATERGVGASEMRAELQCGLYPPTLLDMSALACLHHAESAKCRQIRNLYNMWHLDASCKQLVNNMTCVRNDCFGGHLYWSHIRGVTRGSLKEHCSTSPDWARTPGNGSAPPSSPSFFPCSSKPAKVVDSLQPQLSMTLGTPSVTAKAEA